MPAHTTKIRRAQSDAFYIWMGRLGRYSIHIALIVFALTCLAPFMILVSASMTEETALTVNGYSFVPTEFSLTAYEFILDKPDTLLRAYGVSVFVTVVGTLIGLAFMTLLAYPLSRRRFKFRRFLSLFVFFTALFNGGGLVPYYILVTRYLQLQDTVIILILPGLVGVFQVLLLRTYFAQLPEDLFDAARVDGAGEWRIFLQIVLPLSTPALATIGLMIALQYWNNWTTALYFIRDPDLYPLQYLLYRIMENANAIALEPQIGGTPMPLQSTRMAMAVLAVGPAALAFLFVQRYLVKGITLGSFK